MWVGQTVLWRAGGPWLLLNPSASLPRGLYVLTSVHPLAPGTLVVFPPPESIATLAIARGYLAPYTPLLKPVAALAGETVCVQDDGLLINSAYVGPVATVDRMGRPLPRWRGCVVLGMDEVFPASFGSTFSFDGRYFGPIAMHTIQGIARPLWIW
jgi:conjugative transfer signal peptidase TraF